MQAQAQEQEPVLDELTEPVESDVESIDESVDGETHTEVGADGSEHVTGVFPPFDATTFPSQLLWLAISFGALYLIMSRVALPRVADILEARRDRVEGDLAEADRLRQKTDNAIASYEAELAQARGKAHAIAEETRGQIKADLDSQRSKVEADLAKKVASAEDRISRTKAEALGHVDEIATDTVQALVAQLTGQISESTARDAVEKVTKE
ncbi:F0F1 ATP synthase subunit B [Pelagibacterium montanilacus]|uniref:F0F1 ATP synthase subunit B n=1 Tax=Pelagibacterium montanilacus TaxID=2185280 RepID=UPI000F8EF156|nr:F0F1 ATP synthase subunit B [Pelagibacterium montanilacus]